MYTCLGNKQRIILTTKRVEVNFLQKSYINLFCSLLSNPCSFVSVFHSCPIKLPLYPRIISNYFYCVL